MITLKDSSVIDANSEAMGIDTSMLMVNAASALVSVLNDRFPNKKIAFICGNGNNGGDGIVAAGMMDAQSVTVYLIKPEGSIRSAFVKEKLSELRCPVKSLSEFDGEGHDVIVDCALGTGMTGPIIPPYNDSIDIMNRSHAHIVSVDVPSGLGAYPSVRPDITITFHDIKEGMTSENSGEMIVKDIGIPKETFDNVGPGDMLRYPIPSKDSHKGLNGKLLIIGGGPYYGAPAMSALASIRVGTDIVRLAVPKDCSVKVAHFSPVFMISELSGNSLKLEHLQELLELAENFDAVLIGPGIGTTSDALKTAKDLISLCKKPIVVDADGLTALGKDFVSKGKTILTPHLKEFERLGGDVNNVEDSIVRLAKRTNSVILLKGRTDLISDGNILRRNLTGSPGMTGAGTGDVLAGIVAGLLSKGMSCFDAAALGAFISGSAGEYAFEELSYGMTATDVIDAIPKVLKEHLRG